MNILAHLIAYLRKVQTSLLVLNTRHFLIFGSDLHIGKGTRLWAPKAIKIGSHVYIGKQVNIEANCVIGDYCLLANRVAILGRRDHDYAAVGYPIRYSPNAGSRNNPNKYVDEKAVIECDVWLGYAAIVLTGVTIGRGSIVAAGSIVTKDIPAYSIAAGVPARVVGQRFADIESIRQHEFSLQNGRFRSSELGYDHCVIEPILGK